ncbi:MAG: PDZ domain-containing protein [Pirellulaceae bacterium]|nr:PDZ domain-containing protein [Pirellulaceae bacterium]
MERFVCVRVPKANAIDLTRYQFDFDLTFAVFFLRADGTVYGRYGTRSGADNAVKDMTIDGFAEAMKGALELHRKYPRIKSLLQDKQASQTQYKAPGDLPALRGKYNEKLNYAGEVVKSCVHCHQIRDAERLVFRTAGKPIPEKHLFPFPLPKVLGFQLDPETRATVSQVDAASAAAQAGLRVGDRIVSLDRQPILSTADVQWVLHGARESGTLRARVARNRQRLFVDLPLDLGWRQGGDISWRETSWELRRMMTGGLRLEAASRKERLRIGREATQMALRVRHVGQYGEYAVAKQAGFKRDDIVVSFAGKDDLMTESLLLFYASQNSQPGDVVPVVVIRGDARREMSLRLQ